MSFIIKLVVLMDKYISSGIGSSINQFSWIISLIIFFIILIFGYISTLQNRKPKPKDEEITEEISEEPPRHVRRRTIKRIRHKK